MSPPSILNPEPKFLQGPSLLHHLVSKESSTTAIDHTSGNGETEQLTYYQLHRRSNALAARLIKVANGAQKSTSKRFIVPLFVRQCPDLYVSQLAILKAGGAFCPIVLDVPEERLRFILKDVEAGVLVTTSHERQRLPKLDGINIVVVDEEPLEPQRCAPSIHIDPSQGAYIMYTSGSTGQPKGVILSHSAATQALLAHDRHIPQFSRFLQFASPTFDVSVFEIFFPLFRKSTLVSCDRRKLLNDLPGCINQMNVDGAELTPSVASSLLRNRNSVPGLKVLLTIGEMLKKTVVEEFGGTASEPGILHGMYGPTEATIHCTLQPSFENHMPVGNIGIPLDTVSAFIVEPAPESDPTAAPEVVAVGVEGELAVGGYQLADGYLNRDEQTKAVFVNHSQYGRLYRTGDRARMNSDGSITCLGRISSGQVKLRGQRIELGEIEYAASQAQSCRSAVAEVVEGTLVAFCETKTVEPSTEDIQQSCQKWLPAYMVPGDIVLMDVFPYLASGKVDRKNLRADYTKAKETSNVGPPPLSSAGQAIASIISDILQVEVDGRTKLSNVGLDSLSSIRIASQLRKKGFPQVDTSVMLKAQTISEVEILLDSLSRDQTENTTDSFSSSEVIKSQVLADRLISESFQDLEDMYAASSVQAAMLTETARSSQAYCNWSRFELPDNVDPRNIEIALKSLTDIHNTLRSGFMSTSLSHTGYIVIVWKALTPKQIQHVSAFSYDFKIETDASLLHPIAFQIKHRKGKSEVLVQIHHALYDQWSMDLFQVQLLALLHNTEVEPATAFKEVATFHSATQNEALSDRALDFWQDQLRDFTPTPIPQLNALRVQKALRRTSWRQTDFDLRSCRDKCKRIGVSTPAVFQAALAYVLSCYTGSTDVTFGTVFSGRHIALPGIESVFGPCLATLPCRLDIASTRTCLDLIRLAHQKNRAMQQHAFTPLADIKKSVDCAPDMALFDTLFVWQETTLMSEDKGQQVKEVDSADFHEFNLVVELEPSDQGVSLRATYQSSVVPLEQVDVLLAQIGIIASHMIEQSETNIQNAGTSLTPDLLSISNPHATMCSPVGGVVSKIEAIAAEMPSASALAFARNLQERQADTETISFMELNCRANQLARHLQSIGVSPNELVCICMEKSIDLYVAMLATLKAGAGYLPLIPETPIARIQSIMSQSKVKVAVCDCKTADMFHSLEGPTVADTRKLKLESYSVENLNTPYCGSNIAYAVFTSGTTGEPKGVPVTFENLSGNIGALIELYQFSPGDRLLQACSQAFDVSVFEIFFSFSTGMCLCSAPKEILFQDLEHSIRAFQATHLSMTPTVAGLVDPSNVPSVKFLVTAGEPLSNIVHKKWAGRGLHNGCGPSETTNICSVQMNISPDAVLGHIGRPFRNTSTFVISLNDEIEILPRGSVGEYAFGGEQVFPGYVGMDELNAKKIIHHPEHGRLYRSGDIGRILPDGSLLITGRLDDQVKVRGNRIELGEINNSVMQHPSVSECVTMVCGDDAATQSLVSFWVPSSSDKGFIADTNVMDDQSDNVKNIFSLVESKLPSYMVPHMLIPISKMPLTSQGKLDRRQLKKLLSEMAPKACNSLSRHTDEDDDGTVLSSEEQDLASALAETLQIPENIIHRSSSFFALGLNSLGAILFAKLLEKRLDRRISIETILRNQTIERLLMATKKSSASRESEKTPNLETVFSADIIARAKEECQSMGISFDRILPCTPLQEAMLSASYSRAGSSYANATTFEVAGDMEKLRNCWIQLMERHAILRTHFIETDSSAYPYAQVITEDKQLPWVATKVSDCKDTTDLTKPAVSMQKPFAIEAQALGAKVSMVLHMHHAIYDGISMSILLQEAEKLYHGETMQPAQAFDAFVAESIAQRQPKAMEFWKSYINEFQPKPFQMPEMTPLSEEMELEETLDIPSELIATFCKRHSVTPLSIFQFAWAKTLACAQGASDVCFGNVVSGRSSSLAGIDQLVAPCFNTIPIRVNVKADLSNAGVVRELNQQNIDSLKHQLSPLRQIQQLSKAPQWHLFDSLLLVQPPRSEVDTSIWKIMGDEGAMDLPLVLEITPGETSIKAVLHYLIPGISEHLARLLMEGFVSALQSCIRFASSEATAFVDFDQAKINGTLAPLEDPTEEPSDASVSGKNEAWNKTETAIRKTFARLSGVEISKVQRTTSMYKLGLDSLNAAQIAAQLRRTGMKIDAADVIENLSPSAIASAVSRDETLESSTETEFDIAAYDKQHRNSILGSLGLEDGIIEAIRPATAVQSGMIAQSLHSNGMLYINHMKYEIPLNVRVKDIEHAWRAVQKKHPILRTGFHHIGGSEFPFAMIAYRPGSVEEPFVAPDKSSVPSDIVQKMHRPLWRISIDQADQTMSLSIHHALYDAESLQLILRDFGRAMKSQDIGSTMNIDTLLSTTLSATNSRKRQSMEFWKKTLETGGFAKFPDLAPEVVLERSLSAISHVCKFKSSEIEHYCRQHNATIQSVGQAVWAQLLAAYTGEPQVTFGTVFSGRSSSESHHVAFPSLTTIPVCCDTSKTTAQVIQDMVSYNGSAQRHRFLPLADIQQLAQNGGNRLFDTVFVYQKTSTSAERFEWKVLEEKAAVDYTASLELEILEDDTVVVQLTVDNSLVPVEQAQLMLDQYEYFMRQILGFSDNDTSPSTIWSILPPKEPTLPSSAKLLHEFVEIGATQNRDKVALEFISDIQGSSITSKVWTYKQLNERGNQVARLIQSHGVPQGAIIALCMDKSAEATFAFIGILKAGSSFLPMDPDLPEARKKFILEDSSAQMLIVNAGNKSLIETNVPVIPLTEELLDQFPSQPVATKPIDPSEASYDLYTSGTTGNPKGCEITHENAVQAMLAFQRIFAGHWTEASRWLQFASYWFDVSVLEQFWSWSVGIAVVGAPRDLVLEDLPGFIRTASITHIDLTPSLARILHPDDVPSLHKGVFITGGEALKQDIIDAWGPKGAVCNGYGPTEATIGVTMNPFIGTDAKPSNIGPQFLNVGSYVLQPGTDIPVMKGAVGELCLSGKLVGKGYLNRPDLTAKSFPFLEHFNEKVYRTGDLVRLLSDESFSFIGRQDSQVKLRGQRLEIGEIDNSIKTSSERIVDVVSMVVKENDGGRQTLISFLATGVSKKNMTLSLDTTSEAGELVAGATSACKNQLPPYMVPTHVMPVNFFPLTVNKKIDAKLLKSFFSGLDVKTLQSLKRESKNDGDLNPTERKIASILSNMLEISEDDVVRSSNIFSLGLSSVSAITFASLLKRTGFNTASVAQVMKNPTLGALAQAISSNGQQSAISESSLKQSQLSIAAFGQRYRGVAAQKLSVSVQDIETVTPCTPLQEGLILDSIRREERPYFNEFRYKLHDLDVKRLVKAFEDIAQGVQMLRAKFVETDDGYAQVVVQRSPCQLTVQPSGSQSVEDSVAEKRSQWLKDNQQDLVRPIGMFVLSASEGNTLLIHVHHALYDGVSWDLLMNRLAQAYLTSKQPDCGPKFTDALPYGLLGQTTGAMEFWKQRLQGCSYIPLPETSQDSEKRTVKAEMRFEDAEGVEALRKTLGVSHQAIAQSCFEVALHQLSPNTRMYGQVVSGRSIELPGAENIIGPLFNTIPAAIDMEDVDTWSKSIRRIHEMNAATIPFQHTPLRSIRKWLQQSGNDVKFDILFVFQHEASSESRTDTLWEEIELASSPDSPLAFETTLLSNGQLNVLALAQGNIADQKILDTFLEDFKTALHHMARNSDQQISEHFQVVENNSMKLTGVPKAAEHLNGVHGFEWSKEGIIVREAISQLVGVGPENVDEHSTLFSLGLDSIDAVRLTSRLKKQGLSIQVSQILRAQTIPRMLRTIEENGCKAPSIPCESRLKHVEQQLTKAFAGKFKNQNEIERILPATPSQEGLVADMLKSDFKDYYNHDILRLNPDMNLEKLKAAWQSVIDDSPVLRTGFAQVLDPDIGTTFAQIVYKPRPISFRQISRNTVDELEIVLGNIQEDAALHMDSRCPLRLTIATVKSETYFILSLAHAQYDGHSLGLLHQDVQAAYESTLKKRPANDDITEASLDATSGDARRFWANALSGATVTRFPTKLVNDKPRAIVHRAERESRLRTEDVRSFCQKNGCSIQALAQTCWSLVLASYTKHLEVIFGVVRACRHTEEAQKVMFPAMNTVPVRATLHGSRVEMVQHMQSSINDMLPHQKTPLRVIKAACADVVQRKESVTSSDLFDSLFIYQNRPEDSVREGVHLYESVSGSSSVEYPVACEIEAVGSNIMMRTACKDTVFTSTETNELLGRLDKVLISILSAPDKPTVDFSAQKVSICDLPAFELETNLLTNNVEVQCEDTSDMMEDSIEASAIRNAMARVSKAALESITSTTTTESIGIDSISAIKVAAILRKDNVVISVSDIIRSKTVSRMAQKAMQNAKSATRAPAISPQDVVQNSLNKCHVTDILKEHGLDSDSVEKVLPATAGQVYMISIWQLYHGQLFYPTFSYELKSTVEVERLRVAWQTLVARNEALRTTFCATEDKDIPLLQVVLKHANSSFSHGESTPEHDARSQPFVSLHATTKEGGYKLELSIHHALYDAVSLALLVQEFKTLLAGSASSTCLLKQEDFLALSATKTSKTKAKDFWTSYLSGSNPASLTQPTPKGAKPRIELFQPGLSAKCNTLETFARKEGVTIQSLLFAAYARIYSALTSQSDSNVVLGIYLSNRSHLPDLDSLATPTLNLVPLRVQAPAAKSLVEVAKQIQSDLEAIGSAEKSAVGLWEIAEWTDVRVDTFVNFIKLPERNDQEEGAASDDIVLREMDDRRTKKYSRVAEPEMKEFQMSQGLKAIGDRNGYQYSIDIEATVVNGKLDFGLFAPEEMLSLRKAEAAVQELKRLLEALV